MKSEMQYQNKKRIFTISIIGMSLYDLYVIYGIPNLPLFFYYIFTFYIVAISFVILTYTLKLIKIISE